MPGPLALKGLPSELGQPPLLLLPGSPLWIPHLRVSLCRGFYPLKGAPCSGSLALSSGCVCGEVSRQHPFFSA